MSDIPVVVTTQGATPTPPATLLADLIALANQFSDNGCVVWFNERAVTLVIDDATYRADTATFVLEPSDKFTGTVPWRLYR